VRPVDLAIGAFVTVCIGAGLGIVLFVKLSPDDVSVPLAAVQAPAAPTRVPAAAIPTPSPVEATRMVRCDLVLWHDHRELNDVALRTVREGSRIVPGAALDAIAAGRATLLPNGTQVRVTDDRGPLPEARLEVVDGPYAGRSGWTSRPECV
jgi:hypothetical protein